jgi:hypothetical protein
MYVQNVCKGASAVSGLILPVRFRAAKDFDQSMGRAEEYRRPVDDNSYRIRREKQAYRGHSLPSIDEV